ncbi:MAG: U32 family peptidase [Eubacteriales bacterium]|nr:U32 family peptidase [Eubacteriales bacterium]
MELLAPAGSFECAKAAVNAGADAIYMGGPLYSARAYAESSKETEGESDLMKSIRYCHLRGVKVYMTVNTLMRDKELKGIAEYIRPYADMKLDAFIVQDLGLMKVLKESFPEIPIHMSTQAFVTGPRFAKRLKELGVTRVVPARELSLRELRAIADTGIEVEAFIHGALCYSYSGQCLMSSMIGARSGNRGRCAGPCRLPYEVFDEHKTSIGEKDESYILSMKDLNTLRRLEDLEEAGVMSLKIEGRMKSPVYVAGVVSVYRRWLDHEGTDIEGDLRIMREIFDRGGSTDGYLYKNNGRDMVQLFEKEESRVPDEQIVREITEEYINTDKKIGISLEAEFIKGSEAHLVLRAGDVKAEAFGPVCERASQRPVRKEDIEDKLLAFGTTDFVPVKVSVTSDDDIFIPMGAVKELRRSAVKELEKCILEGVCGNA